MSGFLSALNPVTFTSGVTFRATGSSYNPALQQRELPDLTLDLIIPFLWSQNLSILDGICETFTVFYGDHFDKDGLGFGRKGVLDFTIAPLVSRKLIADTYLNKRQNTFIWNTLAWTFALPIKAINFALALACTIAMIPLIIVVTLLRSAWNYFFPPNGGTPPSPPANDLLINLPLQTATAALFEITRHLDRAGIRTPQNLRRLFEDRHNMALVYVLERVAHTYENNRLVLDQDTYDMILNNLDVFANYHTIELLHEHYPAGVPITRAILNMIVRQQAEMHQHHNVHQERMQRLNTSINYDQSTHASSVHHSTAHSALELEKLYGEQLETQDNLDCLSYTTSIAADLPRMIKQYDQALVGVKSDAEITQSVMRSIQRLIHSAYVDKGSNIKSSTLLQLAFTAFRDPKQWREGVTEETPLPCFYAALYEMDREYALTANGRDVGSIQAAQCCEGGAFNKLIEALSKIHKSCEVNFITPATAGLKLPCVVRQVLKQHLSEHPEISIEALQSHGIDLVWADIQKAILGIMKKDFSSIYPANDGQENTGLMALVNAGQYVELDSFFERFKENEQGAMLEISGRREQISAIF